MTEKAMNRQLRIHKWAAALEDQKASGLSIGQWCEGHDINRQQFYYRQREVRKAQGGGGSTHQSAGPDIPGAPDHTFLPIGETEQQVSFAELPAMSFSPLLPAAAPEETGGTVMRLRYGRSIVEIGNGASDRILEFLRGVIFHEE